jgi:hypothetical protein
MIFIYIYINIIMKWTIFIIDNIKMDKEHGRNALEVIDWQSIESIIDHPGEARMTCGRSPHHCLNQASLQTPDEAFMAKIYTPVGFNYFYLKNMIKIYYSFKKINELVEGRYLLDKDEITYVLDKINSELLLMINIIQDDTNLYYIFNICFNFYNNIQGKEVKYLGKSGNINSESLKLLGNYDYSIIKTIIDNNFDSRAITMQKIINSIKFPLYCAIICIGYWCKTLIIYIRYKLYGAISDLFRGGILDLSSYNNDFISLIEYDLLKNLTLHKIDAEIDSNLGIDDNGIIIINNKMNINYNLRELIINYNQIHAIITGRITEKLKQCVTDEFRTYYSDKDTMDISNKFLFKIGNSVCIQCKVTKPIFYEEGNDKNKFCTKICQMKSYNYII